MYVALATKTFNRGMPSDFFLVAFKHLIRGEVINSDPIHDYNRGMPSDLFQVVHELSNIPYQFGTFGIKQFGILHIPQVEN